MTTAAPSDDSIKVEDVSLSSEKHKYWGKRSHYFVYGMMLGNVDTIVNYTIEIAARLHSGGALILCLVFSTFFVALPLTCMETFVGRYTKKTNGQMYTMVPLFVGYSLFLMSVNFVSIPMDTVHISYYVVDFVSIIGNNSINSQCFFQDETCYDYKTRGKINSTCRPDPNINLGLKCDGLGTIRYPMQYNFWKYYRDPTSGLYPVWKILLALGFVWFCIWLVVFLTLRMAGTLLFIAFLMNLISYGLVFILSVALSGSGSGIYEVTSVDLKHLTHHEFISIMLMSFRRVGLVIPMGHMTFASRLQSKHAHNFFFILLNLLYGIWMLIVAFSVCDVISHKLGTTTWDVTVRDMGLVMVMIPEFLAYMESPFIYVLYVYFCSIFKEIIMSAIAVLMFLYNLLDFFPSMVKFEKYMKVVLCIIFGLVAFTGTMTQHSNMAVLPTMKVVNMIYGTNLILLIETFMVFYLYGINRLSDDFFFLLNQRPNTLVRISWIALPMVLLVSFGAMVWRTQLVILEKPIKEMNNTGLYKHIKIVFLIVFIIMLITSLIYLGCQLGTQNACEHVMKPKFFWGPQKRSERMHRKTFSPSTLIRSQPMRLRKYRTVLEHDESKTVYLEDKWKTMKDIDDLEKALKGAEEDDATAKAAIKVEEQKGRIFSDTEYFGNLQKISHVIIKTSGKVSMYEKDDDK